MVLTFFMKVFGAILGVSGWFRYYAGKYYVLYLGCWVVLKFCQIVLCTIFGVSGGITIFPGSIMYYIWGIREKNRGCQGGIDHLPDSIMYYMCG